MENPIFLNETALSDAKVKANGMGCTKWTYHHGSIMRAGITCKKILLWKSIEIGIPLKESVTRYKHKIRNVSLYNTTNDWFTGWPTIMSLFFFGNNIYKNKETFKIFSPQILEVHRIFSVELTLESIMFYYTFKVTNTMFVPCTVLLYDNTAATRTLKLSTTLLKIYCGIHLISVLMMFSLACGLFSQTLSFRYPLKK